MGSGWIVGRSTGGGASGWGQARIERAIGCQRALEITSGPNVSGCVRSLAGMADGRWAARRPLVSRAFPFCSPISPSEGKQQLMLDVRP